MPFLVFGLPFSEGTSKERFLMSFGSPVKEEKSLESKSYGNQEQLSAIFGAEGLTETSFELETQKVKLSRQR
jgi:hypothetical protein